MISITGDNHLGIGNRNKTYYEKAFENFEYIVNTIDSDVLIIAGDLFEFARPWPDTYIRAKDILNKCKASTIFILVGNHDKRLADGSCAAKVLEEKITDTKKIIAVDEPMEYENILMVPHYHDMFDYIREYNGNCDILVSHFSTSENHKYAGDISETDEMFNKFDLVFIADTHDNIDKPKFVTTGATFYCDVDEMLNNTPSFIKLDNITKTYERIVFNELRVKIIQSLDEATDPNTIYAMVSDELSKLPNVFIKRPPKAKTDDITPIISSVSIVTSSSSIDEIIDSLINEPEINELMKKYIKEEIDIDKLIE